MSSGSTRVLLVPMHIDALYVPEDGTEVRKAFADYSKLPFEYYEDGDWLIPNAERPPNLSETILSEPGSNEKIELGAGIHLHWALPEALTHSAEQDADGAHLFPVVPNRWLVTRRRRGAVEKQWVVESDYLYPDLTGIPPDDPPPDCVAVPFPDHHMYEENGPFQPFRFMGRKVDLEDWSPDAPDIGDYLGAHRLALTATGVTERVPALDHVKATFAAFYPNCRGVFGLHDDDPSLGDALSGITYDLLGWYADPAQDCTGIFGGKHPDPQDLDALMTAFQDRFEWSFQRDGAPFPGRTVFHGRITFQNDHKENPAATDPSVSLAIGNSPTEALSAYLAQAMAKEDGSAANKVLFEEQLEAIPLAPRLNQRALDLGAAFEEARHTQGFTPKPGGILWSVHDPAPTADGKEVTLSDDLAHALSQLNELQGTYDRALDTITSLGERLFSDFCAWMIIRYYDAAHHKDGPDNLVDHSDELYEVVDRGSLAPLRKYMADTGRLVVRVDPSTGQVTADATEVVIRLVSEENTFIEQVVADLGSAKLEDDQVPKDLATHFADCGITLSGRAQIRAQSASWTVTDGGVAYVITRDEEGLHLHIPPLPAQTASRLAHSITELVQKLAAMKRQYALRPTAAPRYWQPNDPVALMVGPAVTSTERFGTDGPLPCALLPGAPVTDGDLADLPRNPDGILERIRAAVDALDQGAGARGFARWTEQPWNPFLLEWKAEYFPTPKGSKGPEEASYDPGAIQGSYALSPTGYDLSSKGALRFEKDAQMCSGFSILTPHAGDAHRQQLAAYLADECDALPATYGQALAGMKADQVQAYLDAHIRDLQKAYEEAHQPPDPRDPIRTALRAYALLGKLPCLSQALGGFNDALLTLKGTMQLDVYDPFQVSPNLGDEPDSMLLATGVSGLVGHTALKTWEPAGVFSPIRSGKLQIAELQLTDSFGRQNGLAFQADTVGSEALPRQDDGSFLLLPRLAQPARLLFRWLSATPIDGRDDPEMNAHPATSPICGWVLPNQLDSSLMVYDARGVMLGLVDEEGAWMPAPGAAQPVAATAIDNPHLRKLVAHLTSADDGAAFMAAFLTAVENALETIEPENFAQHEGLALLMGRPLALVRAALSLEVQGLPARDNSWDVIAGTVDQYRQDPHHFDAITGNPDRFTHAFDKVLFPVRIGEPGRLNDGLVVAWVEDANGSPAGVTFHAPGGGEGGTRAGALPGVVTTPMSLTQSLDAQDTVVTMLVDPRGVVHATSGVLPSKAVSIPPDQFTDALKNIDVTFLIAPILATGTEYGARDGSRKVPVPVPKEPGYTWSWLSQQGRTWSETPSFSALDASAKLPGQQWICEGWLKLHASK